MFNLGLIEFLVVIFFILLLVKPEDIPKVSKNFGLFYRKLSRYFYNIKYELSEMDNEIVNVKKKEKKVKSNEISKSLKRIKK